LVGWDINGIFSTIRLFSAFKKYSLVNRHVIKKVHQKYYTVENTVMLRVTKYTKRTYEKKNSVQHNEPELQLTLMTHGQ